LASRAELNKILALNFLALSWLELNSASPEHLMEIPLPILIVSCRPENRKMLMRIFDGLPVDSYVAPTLEEARLALTSRPFSIVFCEERLRDGSYRELLSEIQSNAQDTQFIVLLCTGEWEEYLEALRLGAEEVLRCPLQPTDVDLALIHAARGGIYKSEMTANA
jgi:DNA-binding NtrC family response regulator